MVLPLQVFPISCEQSEQMKLMKSTAGVMNKSLGTFGNRGTKTFLEVSQGLI
jgi:hypothetical protein